MKIAIAQLNYHIGNIESNQKKIEDSISQASANNADLVLFSEMAICGFPPMDLLKRNGYAESCQKAIEELAKGCHSTAAVIGIPQPAKEGDSNKLYNSAYFIHQGKIKQQFGKTCLTNDDINDEARYFAAHNHLSVVQYQNTTIAVTIGDELCKNGMADKIAQLKADLVVNISATPFSTTVAQRRTLEYGKIAAQMQTPILFVNQTGANADLIFDGCSFVMNRHGERVIQLPAFEEAMAYINLNDIDTAPALMTEPKDNIALIHDALILGIRDYFGKSGFTKATLGLSGGLDSAVVLALAEKALGAENIKVLLMPSKFSTQHSIDDAVGLAQNLNVDYEIVPISDIADSYDCALAPLFAGRDFDVTEENIQARIRGALLMAFSNKFGHILLNTSNKSESAVGYGTLYGDMNGGLAVLGDVYKTDVFQLARYINRKEEIIPVNTILKPPSAELRPDQKDSDSLPDYNLLDTILHHHIELNQSADEIIGAGFDKETVTRIIRMVNNNEHKRYQAAPVLRVSSKSFGQGRKIPLVAKHQ